MAFDTFIDPSTDFCRRVLRRLHSECIGWLVTVRQDGIPEPNPVWFSWDGESFLIYSQPGRQKVRNIERNPRVSFHLDGDGQGGDIIIFTESAKVDLTFPPAYRLPEYYEKYSDGFARIHITLEAFSREYTAAIKVTPEKLRGH